MANTGYGYGSYLSKSLRDQSSSTLVMTDGVWERFFELFSWSYSHDTSSVATYAPLFWVFYLSFEFFAGYLSLWNMSSFRETPEEVMRRGKCVIFDCPDAHAPMDKIKMLREWTEIPLVEIDSVTDDKEKSWFEFCFQVF